MTIALLKVFGIAAASIGIILIVMLIQVRYMAKGKIYCLFIADNKEIYGRLLPSQSDTIEVGSGEKAVKYLTNKDRQLWSLYPPGLPRFLRERVPTLIYAEDNAEPVTIYKAKSNITPMILQKISDDAMLRSTWKDARDSIGLKGARFDPKMVMIIIVITAVITYGAVNLIGG